jgi:hypothetical protein
MGVCADLAVHMKAAPKLDGFHCLHQEFSTGTIDMLVDGYMWQVDGEHHSTCLSSGSFRCRLSLD